METTTATPEAEVFEFKNPKTHRTITLPKIIKTDSGDVEFQPFLEAIIEKSRTDERNKSRMKMEELELQVKDFNEVQTKLNEYETQNLSSAQKAKLESERVAAEIKRAKDEADKAKQSLNSYILKNAVLEGFGKVKNLADVNKAAVLFNAEFQPKLVEKNGDLVPVIDYEGQELSVSEVQAKWIARDDNKILLQNTLASGAGSTGGASGIQSKQMKRADFSAQTPAAQFAFVKDGGKIID